jgi:hypothetical protein
MQAGAQDEDGSAGAQDLGLTDFEFVELYRAKAGTVQQAIGAQARAAASAAEIVTDVMARLKQGIISEDEFLQYMSSRQGQEGPQARCWLLCWLLLGRAL